MTQAPTFRKTDLLTFLVITLLGVFQGKVTVFYIIYLFWFQELLRTLIDFLLILLKRKGFKARFNLLTESFGSFFILFIYLVFILLLLGLLLNAKESGLIGKNASVFLFQNLYFNVNLILFFGEYLYYRSRQDNQNLKLEAFNRRHIILHLSILIGAFLQLVVLPNLGWDTLFGSALVVTPFLLLKLALDR